MLVRICLLAFVLAPCFSGCALPPAETVSTPALEKWAAEHPEFKEGAQTPRAGSAGLSNTERWMEAQKHSGSYEQALKAWQKDDTVACRRILQQVLQQSPQHRDSLLLMAQLEMLDRRPGVIRPALAEYCRTNAADSSAQHMLGLVYESMGEKKAALARYRKAVELAPENLAFQASVDGLTNPQRSILTPEQQPEKPTRPDLLASGRTTTDGLTISEPLGLAGTSGPRRRIVDNYGDESTSTADMLAATQGALQVETNETSIQQAIVARRRGNGQELSQMFASTQFNDIGQPHGLKPADSNVALASHSAPASGQLNSQELISDAAAAARDSNIQQASASIPASKAPQSEDSDTAVLTAVVELVRGGKSQEGLQILATNESLERSARYFRIYGMAQFESGDAKGASASLLRSLSLDDTSALSYFLMGASLSQLGHEADAEDYFRKAARLDPRFARSSTAGS